MKRKGREYFSGEINVLRKNVQENQLVFSYKCPFSYPLQQYYVVVARFQLFQQNPFDHVRQANRSHVDQLHLCYVENSPIDKKIFFDGYSIVFTLIASRNRVSVQLFLI